MAVWLGSQGWPSSFPVGARSITFTGFEGDTPSLIDAKDVTEINVSGLAKSLDGCVHSTGGQLTLAGYEQQAPVIDYLVPFRDVTKPCVVTIQDEDALLSMSVDCPGTVTALSLAPMFAARSCRDEFAKTRDVTRRLELAAPGSISVTYSSRETTKHEPRFIFDAPMAVRELTFTLAKRKKVGACDAAVGAVLRIERGSLGKVTLRRLAFGEKGLEAAVELVGARSVRIDGCQGGDDDVSLWKIVVALASIVGSIATFWTKYKKCVCDWIKRLRVRRKRQRRKGR